MQSKLQYLTVILGFILPWIASSQNFEGKLDYQNYNVEGSDTTESSILRIWIKDHLYKQTITISKNPLLDLGTLYADAHKMSRTNYAKGKVERLQPSLDFNTPNLELIPTSESNTILSFDCMVWELKNPKNGNVVSKLWITKEVKNTNFDQFVELFNYLNTLFPVKNINGWILKREDYRRKNKIFVTELKQLEKRDLSAADMVIY